MKFFDKQDMKLAEKIEPLEEVIDELSKEVKRRHVQRLRNGECTIEMDLSFRTLQPVWNVWQTIVPILESV